MLIKYAYLKPLPSLIIFPILPFSDSIGPLDNLLQFMRINEFIISSFQFSSIFPTSLISCLDVALNLSINSGIFSLASSYVPTILNSLKSSFNQYDSLSESDVASNASRTACLSLRWPKLD